MKEINGNKTINARIRIDYSKNKPQVSFRYPDKKNQSSGSMFFDIFFIWVVICIPLVFYATHEHTKDTLLEKAEQLNTSNYTEFIDYFSSKEYLDWKFKKSNEPTSKQLINSFSDLYSIIWLIVFIPPFIIYFPFVKFWRRIYPDYQAFISRKKYKKFLVKDIKVNKQEKYPYYIELPIFKNIVCDFKASKDFSKYMKEFEIEEYKFSSYQKYRIPRSKQKGKKKYFRKVNEYLWYARWYFDKKPINGILEVIFK